MIDLTKLAETVAKAILDAAAGQDADWEAMTDQERADFMLGGYAAIAAHDAWLTLHGFRIIPPDMAPVPKSDEEAKAMVQAVQTYFNAKNRKKALVGSGLILPAGHA